MYQSTSFRQVASDVKKRAIEVHGLTDVSFVKKGGETALKRLYYRDPLKVLFPRGDVPTAALVTTGGGLFGGDIYEINVHLEQGAQSLVTAQAAEKVYRSTGPDCEITLTLSVDEDACLEWLPQETIIFDQARFRRLNKLSLAKNATALVGEIVVFGRLASGEEVRTGLIRDTWEVKRGEKTVWIDALHLEGDIQAPLNHVSAFGGARALATAVYAAENAEDMLEEARAALGEQDGVRLGVTYVNGLLVCRWLAEDPYQLRKAFGSFWASFRNKALGRKETLPRLWQC